MKKTRRVPIFKILFGALALFLAVWILSGKKTWFSNEPPLQFLSDMDDQFKIKPQVGSSYHANRAGDREPIAHTVPRNNAQYYTTTNEFSAPYSVDKTDYAGAELKNVNTTVPRSELVVLRGQNRFDVMCSPCHARSGEGNGPVAQRGFPPPPSLLAAAKGYSDARLFHIISAGQNIMPSYADKLSVEDRWAVVHYIRQLQGQLNMDGQIPSGTPMRTPVSVPGTAPVNNDSMSVRPIGQVR